MSSDIRELIKEMYARGENHSNEKMRPEEMRREIKKKFPYRFSIPTSETIKSFVSGLSAKKKKKGRGENDDDEVGALTETEKEDKEDGIVPKRYIPAIEAMLLEDNLQTKPSILVPQLEIKYRDKDGKLPSDWPQDVQKFRSRISNIKSTLKKKKRREII